MSLRGGQGRQGFEGGTGALRGQAKWGGRYRGSK